MTNSEDQLKDQLQDLLSSKEFSFEEAQWTKMSAMLDRRKKRRVIGYIMFSGVLVGILLFTGISLFTGNETPVTAQQISAPKQETTQSNQTNSENQNSAPEQIPANDAVVTAPVAASKAPANEKPVISQNNPTGIDQSPETPVVVEEKALPAQPEKIKNTKAPEQNTKAAPINSAPPLTAAVVLNIDKGEEAKSDVTSAAKTEDKPADKNPEQIQEAAKKDDVVQENKSNEKPAETIAQTIVPVPVAAVPVSNLADTKEAASPAKTQTEPVQENKTSPEEAPAAAVAANTVTPEAAPEASAAVAAAKPDTDYVKAKRPDINIEAGGTYMFGWKDGDNKDASGINPLIGINYFMPIGKELKFGVGLQYTSIGHLNNSNYTATKTRLDFGSYTRYTSFTPQVLHYLNVPLKVGFVIDETSMAGAGVTFGYLLTVNSKIEQYEEDINGMYNYSTHKEKGYTQSFNDFQAQLAFFYERRIWNHFRVSGELMYGLTDVKNGNAIPSSITERNSGIKLSLIYRIFDK